MGAVRIERERDGDSERTGGCGGSSKWTGARVLFGGGTICTGYTRRRSQQCFGYAGGEPKHYAAVGNAVHGEQYKRDPLCDGKRQLERESEREFSGRGAGHDHFVALSGGSGYVRVFDVLRIHQLAGYARAGDGDWRNVRAGSGLGNDCVHAEEFAFGGIQDQQCEQRNTGSDQ
jgi:hypothetical protein